VSAITHAMNPRRSRAIAVFAAAALLATFLPRALPAGAAHFTNTEELTAEDNVGSAVAWSASTFPEGAAEAALGRDDDFPDSLASGVLQSTRPLLLTKTDALSDPTKAELERLKVKIVHILGGTGAVSQAVEDALKAMSIEVKRYSGPTRIETAVEVARNVAPTAANAVLARAAGDEEDPSRGFADSLAAGGWAAAATMPVLLTETAKLSEATAAYLKASSIKEVAIVGGRAAVSETVETQLRALGVTVKRVSGPTRFHTALAVAAERGFATAKAAQKVIVAEGQAADAWASGFAAAARSKKDNAPIVLAVGDTLPEPSTTYMGDSAGAVALLCAPRLAAAACDAAATALGQTAQTATELVTIPVTAVGRYDHAVGKLNTPAGVTSLTVTGCGYTAQPIYFAPDGTFYLMMADPAGACSAEFSVAVGSTVRKQTIELSVGEDFVAPSSMTLPELVEVRPVQLTGEGIELRFVFDEVVAPGDAINYKKFRLEWFDRKYLDEDEEQHYPTSIRRDPRNSKAVLAVFRKAVWDRSTTAVAEGGLICPSKIGSTDATKGDGYEPESTTGDSDCDTEAEVGKPWPAYRGGVRDLDGYPNITAAYGVRKHDFTAASSEAPDLVSVGGYDPVTQSLLFTFSEPVEKPSRGDQEVGAASIVLTDGTIKESDEAGWAAGSDDRTLRVSFAGDGLTAEQAAGIRRAFVEAEIVPAKDDGEANTPIAIVVTGGGITTRPDFIGISDPEFDKASVTFEFEEDIDEVMDEETFVVVFRDGTYEVSDEGEVTPDDDNPRKFVVDFNSSLDTTKFNEDNKEKVLYYTVLSGAVRAFDSQLTNYADSIRVTNLKVYAPGETDSPGLKSVKITKKDPAGGGTDPLACSDALFTISYEFDRNITLDGSTVSNTAVDDEPYFYIWMTKSATDNSPRLNRVKRVDASSADNTSDSDPKFAPSGTKATAVFKPATGCGQNGGTTSGKHTFPDGWDRAKYMSMDEAKVATTGTDPLEGFADGVVVPS
jgi:hypothetical protein